MAIRYDDAARRIAVSVRDLIDDRDGVGLPLAQTSRARTALGREVHQERALAQSEQDAAFRAEVSLRRLVAVDEWTVEVGGRADGVTTVGDHLVVEEVKSTPLDARRLHTTTAADFPAWADQLRAYLWILEGQGQEAVGRLVLVSVFDGSQQILGVPADHAAIGAHLVRRCEDLVRERRHRLAWLARRREKAVPDPFPEWRDGQRQIVEAVHWGLDAGNPVLVEAPTGLGKTAAVLAGALRHALPADRQVLFVTARNTQQAGVVRALGAFAGRGLPLRSLVVRARASACLQAVVDCRPEVCGYAVEPRERYRAADLPEAVLRADEHVAASVLDDVGRRHRVCPYDLGMATGDRADVIVGDCNYALDPGVRVERWLGGDAARGFVLVVDEAHQLVERARGWYSPQLAVRDCAAAAHTLWVRGPSFAPWLALAERAESLLRHVVASPASRATDGEKVVQVPAEPFRRLAEEVDRRAVEYAHRAAEVSALSAEDEDPWRVLAWRLFAFAEALAEEQSMPERVPIAVTTPGTESLTLWCVDPAPRLGAALSRFGGVVGMSATLSPWPFHRDTLGLDRERTDFVSVPSPFPREHRRVVVAPRISTAFKDRAEHADATARLVGDTVRAVPGNVVVYFPSFQMLDDLAQRCVFDRDVVRQRPAMDERDRDQALARLGAEGPPVVLLAVLGGVFAEGVDLPAGALSAVVVISPALPPVGLTRELLREDLEGRFGQGFLHASLVPGLTRVIQAAGRLHRRPEDRGVILLVDRRFRWREVLDLLPREWEPTIEVDPLPAIRAFFAPDV